MIHKNELWSFWNPDNADGVLGYSLIRAGFACLAQPVDSKYHQIFYGSVCSHLN